MAAAMAANIQAALQGMANIGAGNVEVSYDAAASAERIASYQVVFKEGQAKRNIGDFTTHFANLQLATARPYEIVQGRLATAEWQQVKLGGDAMAGTFTLSFAHDGTTYTTQAIALDATVAQVQQAINEGFAIAEALRRAQTLKISEALYLAEQYRRRANGVISDMIVGTTEITEQDFAAIVEAGHPPGYTDFRDFIQGDYTYRRALFRAILNSRNSDRGFIDALRVTVDVPDIFDRGTVQIADAAAGASISFSRSFRVAPEVTMTHKGGTAVAIPRLLGAATTTGFTAVLENSSGTRVTGSFTWIAQGY